MGMWSRRITLLKTAFEDAIMGRACPSYPFYLMWDFVHHRVSSDRSRSSVAANVAWRAKRYRHGDHYDFRGIKMPAIDDKSYTDLLLRHIFDETLFPYIFFNNEFPEKMHDRYHPNVFYGLHNDQIDVRVKPGDIVLDAGSWAGDFSAYASVVGAEMAYAFEPTPEIFGYLCKTAELNDRITPVNVGLGDAPGVMTLNILGDFSIGNTLWDGKREQTSGTVDVPITTVDQFVEERGIEKVDFIKADIEGFERHMLKGASRVLREMAPKLAICTYHLPDDPEVLERVILEANPRYRIVHRRPWILFAQVV